MDQKKNDEKYFIAHHGIKGQKWGVRRYQNADGSLTDAGKRKYYNNDGSPTKLGVAYERGISYTARGKVIPKDRKTIKSMKEKYHASKPKPKDEFENGEYFRGNKTKGKAYVKKLIKDLDQGKVTSFVEDSKGNISGALKTKRGVVVRDADGNRVTMHDYEAAQSFIWKRSGHRVDTGTWQ